MRSPPNILPVLVLVTARGPRSSVTVSAGPTPTSSSPQQRSVTIYERRAATAPSSSGIEDEGDFEPQRPLGNALPERAVVHVHGSTSGSGVLVTPSLVITSRRSAPDPTGGAPSAWRVQVAATTLTWTSRAVSRVLVPACDAPVVGLVLAEPSPASELLKVGTAPGEGGRVRMLGFGRCKVRQESGLVSSRRGVLLGVDGPMCSGDVGGAVLDSAGALVGVLVGAGHVEGDVDHAEDAPARHRTEAVRADSVLVRHLIERAQAGSSTTGPVSCD